MRFLIVFAIIGYAAASYISPLIVGPSHGDLQAAAIDATVAAQDHARAIGEGHARAAEAVHLHNAEAHRQAVEINRDIHENSYWGSLAAQQSLVAAAQSQAAAIDGAAHAARAAHFAGPYVAAAPLAYPYAAGLYGHGLLGHGYY